MQYHHPAILIDVALHVHLRAFYTPITSTYIQHKMSAYLELEKVPATWKILRKQGRAAPELAQSVRP